MKIVLYQPEIPQNTGNIGRLCVATNTELCLVRPLGFFLDAKEIRRSGLDYWKHLKLSTFDSLAEALNANSESRPWFFTTKGTQYHNTPRYQPNDLLIFGKESGGLPAEVFQNYPESLVKIPQWGSVRSLNLATSVGIGLYEAYRQLGFPSNT